MQFSGLKEKILHAVLTADRIVGKKESLPILSCLLLTVDQYLTISATNLESAIEIIVPGEVKEKGIIAVPGSVLTQTLRSIVMDKVSLTVEDGNLLIEARGSKTLIKAVPHTEFPIFPKTEKSTTEILFPREELLSGIGSVSYAASHSMIRPELGSLYLSIKDKQLIFASTDSFRLAEKVIHDGKLKESNTEILIPLKHALELEHVLEHIDDSTVALSIEDAHMNIQGDGVKFMSRVVDAVFPNYKEIIPKTFTTEATVLKADFNEALRKARVFAGSEQNIGFHLYPKRKIFTATAQSRDIGEMSDSIEAALEGDDLDINFHIDYIFDCLQSIPSDSIHLAFSGPGRPLVIRGATDKSFTYLAMPLNR